MPWQTTSAGSAPPSTSSSAAPTRCSCATNDSPPGNAKSGSASANAANSSGASAMHVRERAVGPVAGVGLHQARVLARLAGRCARPRRRRFRARAAAGCTTARRSRSRRRARPARPPARGRCRRAAPAAGPGSDPPCCRPSARGAPGRCRCGARRSGAVEAVEVHDLVPRGDEVVHELLAGVVARVDLGERAQLGVRAEHEVDRGGGPPRPRRWRGRGPRRRSSAESDGFHSVPMSSRLTKKSLVSVSGRSVRTPCAEPPWLAPSARRPPISTVISGAVSVSM